VTANGNDNTVSVLLGNGNGTFQPQHTFPVGFGPVSVAVADLGNGYPDILTANNSDNTVSVLLGTGNGTFFSPSFFSSGTVFANDNSARTSGGSVTSIPLEIPSTSAETNFPSLNPDPSKEVIPLEATRSQGFTLSSPTNYLPSPTVPLPIFV